MGYLSSDQVAGLSPAEQQRILIENGYPATAQNVARYEEQGWIYKKSNLSVSMFLEDMGKPLGEKIIESRDGFVNFIRTSIENRKRNKAFQEAHPKYAYNVQFYAENLQRLPEDKLNDPEFMATVLDYVRLYQPEQRVKNAFYGLGPEDSIPFSEAVSNLLDKLNKEYNIFDPNISTRERFDRFWNVEFTVAAAKGVKGPKKIKVKGFGGKKKLLTEMIPPRGFKSLSQYKQAMNELNTILKSHGIDDTSFFRMRGSSTTGLSRNPYKPGKWWSPGSDIDLSIQSEKLSKMLYDKGIEPSRNIPGLFSPNKMNRALPKELMKDLKKWNKRWVKEIDAKDIMPAVTDPNLVVHDITDILYEVK